ncbi:MAG TPA: S41 family peptidase [Roseiflexaceae bacterium]|nr:S41 family peptidase [Roseiflexaceae bacterium]
MSALTRAALRGALAALLLTAGFAAGWIGNAVFGDALPLASLVPALGPGLIANQGTPPELRQRFGVFWEVWNLVESQHYQRRSLDRQRMIWGAIRGMLATLDDQYTVYQEPELASQTSEHMQGRQGGIGTYLRITDGRAYLWKPFRNGPAVAAGLKQDDEILAVNGQEIGPLIAGLDINEAAVKVASLLRGQPGTQVLLRIRSAGDGAEFEITLTRANIVVPSVESRMFDSGVAYIRISEFKANTTGEFDQALRELLPKRPKGLILDLRNNPGGFLQNAQEVLGRLYSGTALFEEDGDGTLTELRTIAGEPALAAYDLPLVVLVNGGSASASEIVAGALRDRRADVVLLGEKTFGKGSVQNIYTLSDGSSARITFAHWLTPDKQQIHTVGIVPQYVVPYAEDKDTPAPCVADRQPATGQSSCADNQLFYAIRLLTTGTPPPVTPAASR